MPVVTHASLSDKATWQEALRGVRYSFYQTWDYCHAIRQSQEKDVELLKIADDRNGLLLSYSKRSKIPEYFDIYSPYGFGGISAWGNDMNALYDELVEWLRSNKVITAFLMSHPVFANPGRDLESHRSAFVLELNKDEEKLWQAMGNGHKYEIKKNEKIPGFSITDDKDLIFRTLPKIYRETTVRVGAHASYDFSDATLAGLVFTDSALVLGGIIDGELKAVIVIHHTSECAEYFLNATKEDGRHLTRSLLWEGIRRLRAAGVKKFNLGGGATEGDALEQFKKRMGGEKMAIPVYKKVLNQQKYEELCATCRTTDNGYFPPYWKK